MDLCVTDSICVANASTIATAAASLSFVAMQPLPPLLYEQLIPYMDRPPSIDPSECSLCSCSCASTDEHRSLPSTGRTTPIDPICPSKRRGELTIAEMDEAWKARKQPLRRHHATHELIQTERDYVRDLGHLSEIFFEILSREEWIPHEHKRVIIRNAQDILIFNRRFLKALETCLDQSLDNRKTTCELIAQVFLDMADDFMVYAYYCDMHAEALALYADYRTRPEWTIFLKKCSPADRTLVQGNISDSVGPTTIAPSAKALHFEDYLIKPVQRICRYPLLLKDLVRYTSPHAEEYSLLNDALTAIQNTVGEIDYRKYTRDSKERTELFVLRLENDRRIDKQFLPKLGNLMIAGGLEVSFTPMGQTVSKTKYLGCFLFPTYIMLVRPKKSTVYEPKHWFSLRQAVFEDVLESDGHVFAFNASCFQEKQLWVKRIREAMMFTDNQGDAVPSDLREAENSLDFSFTESSLPPAQHTIRQSRSFTNMLDFATSINYPSSQTSKSATTTTSTSTNGIRRSVSTGVQLCGETFKGKERHNTLTTSINIDTRTAALARSYFSAGSPASREDSFRSERSQPASGSMTPELLESYGTHHRRPSSIDLLMTSNNTTANMIGKMSSQIKNNHKHTIRMAIDHKLRDVCTQDYLSSRAWHMRDKELLMLSQSQPQLQSQTSNYGPHGNYRKRKSTPFLRPPPSNGSLLLARRASEAGLISRSLRNFEYDDQSNFSLESSVDDTGLGRKQSHSATTNIRRLSQNSHIRLMTTDSTRYHYPVEQLSTIEGSSDLGIEDFSGFSPDTHSTQQNHDWPTICNENTTPYQDPPELPTSSTYTPAKPKSVRQKRAFVGKILDKLTGHGKKVAKPDKPDVHSFPLSRAPSRHNSDMQPYSNREASLAEISHRISVSDPVLPLSPDEHNPTQSNRELHPKLKHKRSFFGRIKKEQQKAPTNLPNIIPQSSPNIPLSTAFAYASTPAQPQKLGWKKKLSAMRQPHST
ncbi:hypothetical protein PHYBLDRAFT_145110 [Phycomyces blakesleeanus NRRL 1555(-)]|uniref:DH domain-containing protein n=2 Tax=Phycomyces blakesleeanus TaxID=4837 RepID=A0A167MR48_PHYB8|nr:hypothetical protein PHYBLDRAFT_145110 [Phycomyces blakesleeanus NRRL 1555(-)]OAD73634.1 hypothetical protein PHYBLDRAFT_145110 [Phycomyces blakesleeanus NRRL 1555(-)]|eukprot:XP_018291674.1 hypothetical protein PHYBLDRAFT_145110 [Phycomyces blakesleeanus NRRL 1555(-)]